MTAAAPDAQRGFVLPAVLVVVGVVSLIFLVAITALDSLADQTRRIVDEVRFRQAALSLEAEAAWFAATRPLAPAAIDLGEAPGGLPAIIALDGRAYASASPSGLTVSLQDEAGLINLDALDQNGMARLFTELGAAPAMRGRMADRLADFLDPDDLKRLEGAEAPDYRHAGLPPPPDAPLRRTAQLFGLMGWGQQVDPAAWSRMRDVVTADPTTAVVNANTAPRPALRVLFGLTDAEAAAATARRGAAPFVSLEDFGRAAGVALVGDAERVYTFPSGRFALKITDPAAGLVARSRIVLTPADPERPVWFDDRGIRALPADEKAERPTHAPPFPRPSA